MPQRRVQETNDTKRLFVQCGLWENNEARRTAEERGEHADWEDYDELLLRDELAREAENTPHEHMQQAVQQAVHKQVLRICQALHEVDRMQESHSAKQGLPSITLSAGAKNAVQDYVSQIRTFLREQVGFCISAADSTVPGAGTGVHLQGEQHLTWAAHRARGRWESLALA